MRQKFHSTFWIYILNMIMKCVLLYFTLLIFAQTVAIAQEKPQILINLAQNDRQSGQIVVMQPEQLENLLSMQINNNRQQEGIPGYRIRIFSGSGQNALPRANETRTSFNKNFPEMEAYQEYNNPNFQVFVGDFRTKNDALRELKKIQRRFSGAFIVPDIIDISK